MITSPLIIYKLTIEKNEHLNLKYNSNYNNPNVKLKEIKKKHTLKKISSTKLIHFAPKTPWNFLNPSQSLGSLTDSKPLFNTGVINKHNTEKGIIVLKDFTSYKRKPISQKELDRVFLEKISLPINKVYRIKKKERPMTSSHSLICRKNDDRITKYKASNNQPKKITYNNSNCNIEFLKLINPHLIKIKSAQYLYYQLRKKRPIYGNTKVKINNSFFH